MRFSPLGQFQEGNGQISRALIIVEKENLQGESWQTALLLQVLQSMSLHSPPEDLIKSILWHEEAISKIRKELENQAAEKAAQEKGESITS